MKKFIPFVLMLTMLLACQSILFAAEPATQTVEEKPIWRIDNKNISTMPKNFRMANDPF
ncbi:hypothetical protein [Pelosinus propionicus]|uniref:Uncharacterized protein n=1 Tax=Pelosinus propionicus DSM 13327 TaxID=1123291 RepID=A0A1I4L5T2_9FIRM|nr:hypothetical protein [Pelosinus propionicus]SFL86354.1 hypothetical protein SAMN04490355_102260 [Pelosinus propionicus DSM 13327]